MDIWRQLQRVVSGETSPKRWSAPWYNAVLRITDDGESTIFVDFYNDDYSAYDDYEDFEDFEVEEDYSYEACSWWEMTPTGWSRYW